jgi:hypothetical protein
MGRRQIARLRASLVRPILPQQLELRRSRCVLQLPPQPDEDETASSSSFEFNEKDGTLSIAWSGPIVPGMADYLRTARRCGNGRRPRPPYPCSSHRQGELKDRTLRHVRRCPYPSPMRFNDRAADR